VLSLGALALGCVNCTDAFFEAKQRFVNVGAFSLSVFIIADAVSSALGASQVD
jgi:hypothetical protein